MHDEDTILNSASTSMSGVEIKQLWADIEVLKRNVALIAAAQGVIIEDYPNWDGS